MHVYSLMGSTANSWLPRATAVLALTMSLFSPLWAQAATGLNGSVNVSATSTLVGQVNVGDTQVDVTIPVSGVSSLRVQAIIPVPGATVMLIDPNGGIAIGPNDPRLSFIDGQALSPPLPGGVFITPEIASPVNGSWVLRAKFAAAPTRTIALLTVFAASPYLVGIVQSGQTFYVGQPVALGLLAVFNGTPIIGLRPTLKVSKDNALVTSLSLVDNGQAADFDGLANDGIYSKGLVFNAVGRYLVAGEVIIPSAGGIVMRSAVGVVDIVARNYALNSVSGSFSTGAGGCVSQLNVSANATARQVGTYSTAATLKSSDGTTFVKRTSKVLASPGTFDTALVFTSKEIRSHFVHGGVFMIDPLDVVSSSNDLITLEARRAAAYVYPNLPIALFCVDPIEIGLSASVTAVQRAPFIGQLNFRLPISVTSAGVYDVSFKVTDSQRKEVGQFAVRQTLAAGGVGSFAATVQSDRLQTSDGPFNIESVLVVGAGRSAQASRLPVASSTFSRWQFFPTITGDMNGDGTVDVADRDILLSFRNTAPLTPGDRRDLNADGKIDLIDARLLVLRACKSPNCPRN